MVLIFLPLSKFRLPSKCVYTHTHVYAHTYVQYEGLTPDWLDIEMFFWLVDLINLQQTKFSFHSMSTRTGVQFTAIKTSSGISGLISAGLVSAVSVLTISMTDGRCCSYHTTPNSKKSHFNFLIHFLNYLCSSHRRKLFSFFCQI